MRTDIKQLIGLGVNNSLPNFVPIHIKLPEIKEPKKKNYGVIHNEQPVIKLLPLKEINKDSILDTINTGFGDENTLHKECPKPKFHLHLCKENFLGEFKTLLEKLLARDNLEIYSKTEIDLFIKDLTNVDTSSFITKDLVTDMLQDLDFVKSTLKSSADYSIPENLFKL